MQVGVLESAGLTRVRELLVRIEADALAARFSRGAAWALAAAVASQGLALVASVAVGRILGAKAFGELAMIQSTVGMFGVVAGVGLGTTATKYISEARQSDPDRAGRVLSLTLWVAVASSGMAALLLFLFAHPLAGRSLGAPHLEHELKIGCALLLLNGVTTAQAGALAGFEAFKRIAKVNLVRGLALVCLSVLGAAFWGLRGAVWALVGSAAVSWLVGRLALVRECYESGMSGKAPDAWSERRVLWDFSTPAFLASAMVTPVTWLANALLVNQPNGYREMGIFNAANQWRMAIGFLPSIVTQPTLPMLSSLLGHGDLRSYRHLLRITLALVTAITTFAASVIAAGASWIMGAYGRDFRGGATTLRLLAGASVIGCMTGVVGCAIASMGRMWAGFSLNLFWAVVFLVLTVRLVPRYGALGLAAATMVSYVIHALSVGAYTRHVLLSQDRCASRHAA